MSVMTKAMVTSAMQVTVPLMASTVDADLKHLNFAEISRKYPTRPVRGLPLPKSCKKS